MRIAINVVLGLICAGAYIFSLWYLISGMPFHEIDQSKLKELDQFDKNKIHYALRDGYISNWEFEELKKDKEYSERQSIYRRYK